MSLFFCIYKPHLMCIFPNILCIMCGMRTNKKFNTYTSDKKRLIQHAKTILESDLTGVQISEGTGVNTNQVYAYRNGTRPIENARVESLWKFEDLYQTHDLFEKTRNEEKEYYDG